MSSRRLRWLVFALVGAGVVGSFAFAAYPMLRGWNELPAGPRKAALRFVEEARGAEAARWSPTLLAQAEQGLRASLAEESAQGARLFFRRDFRQAREKYLAAEQQAKAAYEDALERSAQLKAEAESSIRSFERSLEAAERVGRQMPLPSSERKLLQRARIHLAEARTLYAASEYGESASCARLGVTEAEGVCRGALPLASRYTDRELVRTWVRWKEETVAWSKQAGAVAVIVYKEKNLVALYSNGKLISTFKADMGRNSLVAKQSGGDWATPEGRYKVVAKKGRGHSKYYKALLLDYPNQEDRRRFQEALRSGLVPKGSHLGAYIEIHGEGGRDVDWTRGCVALSNSDMDKLFARVQVGTPVTIIGGDGQGGAFSSFAHENSPQKASD